MKIERNPHNVANYLKCVINKSCVDGFKWYPEVEKAEMGLFDITYAIEILEKAEVQSMEMVDDEEYRCRKEKP
jgi:hypothetical protein